jgi:hypothetical protein
MAIYGVVHAPDADGAGAMWVFQKFVPGIKILTSNYGIHHYIEKELLESADMVYYGDFCPPPEFLDKLQKAGKKFRVLDHHADSKNAVAKFDVANGTNLMQSCTFDEGMSGALVAWYHFSKDEPPKLLKWVDKIDRYTWETDDKEDPRAKVLNYYLSSFKPSKIESFNKIMGIFEKLGEEGAEQWLMDKAETIKEKTDEDCSYLASVSYEFTIAGTKVLACNAGSSMTNYLGEMLYKKHSNYKTGCVYQIDPLQEMAKLSFRGPGASDLAKKVYSIRKDGKGNPILDNSGQPKKNYGGGHANAAACAVNLKNKTYPDQITFEDILATAKKPDLTCQVSASETRRMSQRG